MVFRLNLLTPDEPKYNTNSKPRLPFLKPKPLAGSAFCPVVSKSLSYDSGKRGSICSQEVYRTITEFKHSLNDSMADQLLIESTKKGRPQSPVPDDKGQDFTSAEAPHEIRSLLPQNNYSKTVSPNQLVTFPPEIPSQYCAYLKSPTPEPRNQTIVMVEPVFKNTFKVENTISQCPEKYSELTELKYLPKFPGKKGPISTAMEIAPDRPFFPVAVTEPIIKPLPWVSLPIVNENRSESPLIAALKTAPERSYSPLPTFTYADEFKSIALENSNKEVKKSILAVDTSSTLAQNFNFNETNTLLRPVGSNPIRYMHGYNNKTPSTSLQNNKALSQLISTINSKTESSLMSGPYNPIESKSNYNETFITRTPDLKKINKYNPEHISTTSGQNVSLKYSQNQYSISKPQQSSISDEKSTYIRSVGPGIKNKVSTFTPNTSICDKLLKHPPSNGNFRIVPSIDKSILITDNHYTHKNNHPNSVKLTKAVPFFSNNTYPSS